MSKEQPPHLILTLGIELQKVLLGCAPPHPRTQCLTWRWPATLLNREGDGVGKMRLLLLLLLLLLILLTMVAVAQKPVFQRCQHLHTAFTSEVLYLGAVPVSPDCLHIVVFSFFLFTLYLGGREARHMLDARCRTPV